MLARLKEPKGLLFGAGVMGALAGAYLLGSATLGAAFAQTPGGEQGHPDTPAYTSSIQVPDNESKRSEADEAKELAKLATITPEQARAAALARFPGGTVKADHLENENGSVVYSVEVVDSSGAEHDVKVDAGNGTVLQVEAETADGAEGTESD